MQRLYKILHFFVTLFFTVLLNSRYYINLTKRKIHWAFSDENAESKILTEVATLTSLPRHLTLILLESNVDLTILAKIIVWSFTIGISYVSVYSTDDDRRTELYDEVYQIRQDMTSCDYELQFSDESLTNHNGLNGSGQKAFRKVHLSTIPYHKGKEEITKVAQDYCIGIKNKDNLPNIMSVEHMNNLLEDQRSFPDPDLALVFGQLNSVCNYPPWQIRLTEFIFVPSLAVLDHFKFLETLHKYSKCEQRFGR
ncbi:dehydrodolichyl diphosphate synthase complex subunit Nus1-like isoform X2 [Xenia sp. Carnegie-2017]|uniref:dehydrodolichyl diphosphate synthase complex subunit Nus1-like isoform X2 n=1 Tax=Xenia sp. Carnegie-2017 TaxID=2897299 RepID=UPI001F03DAD7|nr:dehydrodolichyl diphosphate synthase complex subunit Nus1-like isoform X2 [Xenia sp. Carnegie-2017]